MIIYFQHHGMFSGPRVEISVKTVQAMLLKMGLVSNVNANPRGPTIEITLNEDIKNQIEDFKASILSMPEVSSIDYKYA